MGAEIRTVKDPELRVKIVEERARFDENPQSFRSEYDEPQGKIKDRLETARENLKNVTVSKDIRLKISEMCSQLDVDGLRGDIVTNRAAKALTTFEGRNEVTEEDVGRVCVLCLRHRLRKDPLESIDSGDKVGQVFREVFGIED